MNHQPKFVVDLSTPAGGCLTSQNWQALGIEYAAYSLAALLVKPGEHCLKQVTDLGCYLAWPQGLVLDASMLSLNKAGHYMIVSSYDGQRLTYTPQQILTLMSKLQPDMVLLPSMTMPWHETLLWTELPDSILPFFATGFGPQRTTTRSYGYYCMDNDEGLPTTSSPLYQITQTVEQVATCDFWQSNRPAEDGYHGLLYHSSGVFNILDAMHAEQFTVIDAQCHCPTCQQQFTRAYLHHLFQHTPLLCQRLLIQHNVYYIQQKLTQV